MTNSDKPKSKTGKPKSKRGGKRPGAGAPKGNLNALKHGRRSAQFAEFGRLVSQHPKTRASVLAWARRWDIEVDDSMEAAAKMLQGLYDHADKIAQGKPSTGPFEKYLKPGSKTADGLNVQLQHLNDAQSAEKPRPTRRPGTRATHRKEIRTPNNQTTSTNPENNQLPDTKTPPKTPD
jgi:hypothetical protein